jgi:hypothetical protein
MRTKVNETRQISSQFITFLADFGIPILDSAAPEPSTTIMSDLENGTVS